MISTLEGIFLKKKKKSYFFFFIFLIFFKVPLEFEKCHCFIATIVYGRFSKKKKNIYIMDSLIKKKSKKKSHFTTLNYTL